MQPEPNPSAAARWVDGYLLPALATRLGRPLPASLRCLQVEPDDEQEAIHLRRLGHQCELLLFEGGRMAERAWEQAPLVAHPARLPVADRRYDLIWSGAFGRINRTPESRTACARELRRACAPGGGVLLIMRNRASPVGLHGARADGATLAEMERAFREAGGYAPAQALSLAGIFGWSRLRGPFRVAAGMLEHYLRWASAPGRPRRYASALNPMLALWFASLEKRA